MFSLSFWNGDGSWRGYKATTIGICSGLGKALLDNYWVMTNTELSGHDGDEPVAKTFYMLGQISVTLVFFGTMGLTCDYVRSLYHQLGNHEEARIYQAL